tara:strand:- start:215 stop:535 length:321 start_codon:yes stop_codon:yes gene_type:complete
MDLVKQAQKKRLNKIKNNSKKELHGWLLVTNIQRNNNKIYSNYYDNSYVEVSCVTENKINPYVNALEVEYKGVVNEYLGNMPPKNNIIDNLLNKIYDDTYPNKYIF